MSFYLPADLRDLVPAFRRRRAAVRSRRGPALLWPFSTYFSDVRWMLLWRRGALRKQRSAAWTWRGRLVSPTDTVVVATSRRCQQVLRSRSQRRLRDRRAYVSLKLRPLSRRVRCWCGCGERMPSHFRIECFGRRRIGSYQFQHAENARAPWTSLYFGIYPFYFLISPGFSLCVFLHPPLASRPNVLLLHIYLGRPLPLRHLFILLAPLSR